MPIRFVCPSGHRLVVPDERAGKKGRCPVCREKVIVPVADPHADPDTDELAGQVGPSVPGATGIPAGGGAAPGTAPASAPPAAATEPPPGPEYAPGPEYSQPANQVSQKKTSRRVLAKASGGKAATVYQLAVGLAVVVIASAVPAMGYLNLITAPGWARGVFLVAALQLAYVLWMVTLPDWSTVWVGMWLFAIVAALYAMVWMIVVYTAPGKPIMLSLDEIRQQAAGWCAIMVLLMSLMSYICGRVSADWRKAFELAKAGRTPSPV